MSPYWMGVLTLPALALACIVVYVAFHVAVNIVGRISNAAVRLGPEMSRPKREHLGAAVFAAKRGWVFGAGDVGIAIFAGMVPELQREASQSLRRTISLAEVRKPRGLSEPSERTDDEVPLS